MDIVYDFTAPADAWVARDYETSSLHKYTCKIAGLGYCFFDIKTGKVYGAGYTEEPNYYIEMADSNRHTVFHNALFDEFLFLRDGNVRHPNVHDTMLMAKHVNNMFPAYDLKYLSWAFFGELYPELVKLRQWFLDNGLAGSEDDMDLTLPPTSLVAKYCIKDVRMTARLAHLFYTKLGLNESYAYEEDRLCIQQTLDMEYRGIAVDLPFLKDYQRRAKRRALYNRKKAAERMGVDGNPMGNALRNHLADVGETRTTATGMTLANDVVLRENKNRSKALGSAQRVRKDEKTVGTYTSNLLKVAVPMDKHPDVGIVHANYRQSAAETRRYTCGGLYGSDGSSAKGQTQNVPSVVREGFIARPGYEWWVIDLSSIEARMVSSFMELLMGESTFSELYRADPFFNPYLWVIEQCTGHGQVTKKHPLYVPYKHVTLGRLYCSGVETMTTQLRDKFELDYTVDEVWEIRNNIDTYCPFIQTYQKFLLKLAEGQGYLTDLFGAVYMQPKEQPYKIIAHLHQGAATMVLRWWWNRVAPLMKKAGDHVVNVVHDELDMEILKKGGRVKRVKGYCDVLKDLDIFDIPITAEAKRGKNWKEC